MNSMYNIQGKCQFESDNQRNDYECVYQSVRPETIDMGKQYVKWLLKSKIPIPNLVGSHSKSNILKTSITDFRDYVNFNST